MAHRILLIEDDPLIGNIIKRSLDKSGFEVRYVTNGEEGMKEIEQNPPDLILLDIILPGMNGFDLLQRVKKNPERNTIPVIVISNLGSRDDVDKGISLGADAYLVKSNVLPEEIIAKVKSILQGR